VQVLYVGGWQAPFGITLVADLLATLMVLVAALMHLAVSVYSLANVDVRRQRYGYFAFLNVMLMGVCGAFLTGDLFNLYVWFEVMLIGSFVLLVLGGGRAQMEAGIKYVTLSLLSSALFLAGVGVIYGIAHTLNMAHLSERLALAAETDPWLVVAASVLLLLSFGLKAAVFPLYFWLPASYHTPCTGRVCDLRRPADESWCLRPDPRVHGRVAPQWLHAHPAADHRRPDDAPGGARRRIAVTDSTDSQFPHRQPDRIHGHGAGPADVA
jgi:NADH:ubiquinone oxidoreductase subunit 4 (subunit M)